LSDHIVPENIRCQPARDDNCQFPIRSQPPLPHRVMTGETGSFNSTANNCLTPICRKDWYDSTAKTSGRILSEYPPQNGQTL